MGKKNEQTMRIEDVTTRVTKGGSRRKGTQRKVHLPTPEASSLRSVDLDRTENTRNFPILKTDTPSDN